MTHIQQEISTESPLLLLWPESYILMVLSSHEFDDLGNLRSHGSRRNIFSFGVINTENFIMPIVIGLRKYHMRLS